MESARLQSIHRTILAPKGAGGILALASMSSPFADRMALRRWIIVAVACFVAVWAGVLLTQNPFLLAAGVVVSIYLGTLAVNARPLAWLIIALQPAALI